MTVDESIHEHFCVEFAILWISDRDPDVWVTNGVQHAQCAAHLHKFVTLVRCATQLAVRGSFQQGTLNFIVELLGSSM